MNFSPSTTQRVKLHLVETEIKTIEEMVNRLHKMPLQLPDFTERQEKKAEKAMKALKVLHDSLVRTAQKLNNQ